MSADGQTTPQNDETGTAAAALPVGITSEKIGPAVLTPPQLTEAARSEIAAAAGTLSTHLVAMLNAALAATNRAPVTGIAEDTLALLHRAWSLAELLRSDAVAPLHVVTALFSSDLPRAERVAEIVKAEPIWLATGALVRPVVLDTAASVQPIYRILPAPLLLEWIAEAASEAGKRPPGQTSLNPDDLLAVLARPANACEVRDKLVRVMKLAASHGRTPAEFVRVRNDLDSAKMTLSYFRSDAKKGLRGILRRMRQLDASVRSFDEGARTRLAPAEIVQGLTSLQTKLDALRPAGDPKEIEQIASALAALERRVGELQIQPLLGPIVQSVKEIFDIGNGIRTTLRETGKRQDQRLLDIETSTRELADRLPAPLSTGWLALAVSAVLAVGAGAGLFLAGQ